MTDIEWTPVAVARAELKHWNASELQARWRRWRRVKDELDREWLAAQNARVAEIALDIDRDRQRTRLDDEEAKRREYLATDARENQKWADAVSAAMGRAVNREKRKLQRDIDKFNAQIRAGLKRRFRPAPLHFPGAL